MLVSTYEMGRQPFGLASPAAWLAREGAQIHLLDLSVEQVDEESLSAAGLVGFYLPMHTATRLAAPLIERTRVLNPEAHIAAYGLYATLNEDYLRDRMVDSVVGPDFEQGLVDLYRHLSHANGSQPSSAGETARLTFANPERRGLPELDRYAKLQIPPNGRKTVGYTETTRGCKHFCRHCPVVPVYEGRFRIVPPEVVFADIANQIAAGAEHITFGDPDFFNGPAHAVRVVERVNEAFPSLTYDATIKVEHLAERRDLIPWLVQTGCAFVTTAVESFDDGVLSILDKGHTTEVFEMVLEEARRVGLPISPTFVAFTPWTTLTGYGHFLENIRRLGLVDTVAPIQYAIRLLLPEGSLLLDLPEVQRVTGPYDQPSLTYPWTHTDPMVDQLQEAVLAVVGRHHGHDRRAVFREVWRVAQEFGAVTDDPRLPDDDVAAPATIPYLTEPWYC